MYITSTEYGAITGRPVTEATTYRILVSCKLLDSRIGNYLIQSDGYKINSSTWKYWWKGVLTDVPLSQKDAVQLWVSQMVAFLTDNNDLPPNKSNNIRLGRFSVGKNMGASAALGQLPEQLNFADSILVSSGIINRAVKMA